MCHIPSFPNGYVLNNYSTISKPGINMGLMCIYGSVTIGSDLNFGVSPTAGR